MQGNTSLSIQLGLIDLDDINDRNYHKRTIDLYE